MRGNFFYWKHHCINLSKWWTKRPHLWYVLCFFIMIWYMSRDKTTLIIVHNSLFCDATLKSLSAFIARIQTNEQTDGWIHSVLMRALSPERRQHAVIEVPCGCQIRVFGVCGVETPCSLRKAEIHRHTKWKLTPKKALKTYFVS